MSSIFEKNREREREREREIVCWLEGERERERERERELVGWLLNTSQHHASILQGQICSDMCTCCHTEIEFTD